MKAKNVLILHTDQQRFNSMGCSGNPFARTPNLDRLAAEGTVFERHIAANPICMPSRASLMTGLYPPGHNVWRNGVALNRADYFDRYREPNTSGLLPQPWTIADHFAEHGYQTACFGKMHLTPFLAPAETGFPESTPFWATGALDDWNGPYYGFQHAELVLSHGAATARQGHYARWLQREAPNMHAQMLAPLARMRPDLNDLGTQAIPFELHNTHWLADRFSAYIEDRDAQTPFMAFVGFPDPHHPFCPAADIFPDFMDMEVETPVDPDGTCWTGLPILPLCQMRTDGISAETRRRVLQTTHAMNHQIDLAVGMIVDALERKGILEETIILFTADHGDFLFDHGLLRKGRGGCDVLLRLPCLLRAPGVELPARSAVPMSNCDVFPTLARLAGIPQPADIHGKDIVRCLQNGDPSIALAYSYDGDPQNTNLTIYDARFRMTYYPGLNAVELFDHQDDPSEMRNLGDAASHAVERDRLLDSLRDNLMCHNNPILARWSKW